MNRVFIALLSAFLVFACSEVEYSEPQTKVLEWVNPLYPIQAARDGIEGHVRLSYDIDENGLTQNVKVIEGNPVKTFNKVAMDAVSQWRFEQLIIDGKAVAQKNIAVQLDFQLTEHGLPKG